jgi:hypothetical protein
MVTLLRYKIDFRTIGGINKMGFYFKGRIVTDENIAKRLRTDEPKGEHIGNRIWIWENQKTGETIITGDEGNSWYVILAEGDSKDEAIAKLEAKMEKNEIFTERVRRILKECPDAT